MTCVIHEYEGSRVVSKQSAVSVLGSRDHGHVTRILPLSSHRPPCGYHGDLTV